MLRTYTKTWTCAATSDCRVGYAHASTSHLEACRLPVVPHPGSARCDGCFRDHWPPGRQSDRRNSGPFRHLGFALHNDYAGNHATTACKRLELVSPISPHVRAIHVLLRAAAFPHMVHTRLGNVVVSHPGRPDGATVHHDRIRGAGIADCTGSDVN